MYYDERLELGNNGLISYPIKFTRDDIQYSASAFGEMILPDIYTAVDVTPAPTMKQIKGLNFTAVKVDERYEITYQITDISAQDIDLARLATMLNNGKKMTLDDDARKSIGHTPAIKDRAAHDAWLIKVYDNTVSKPPADERQEYTIAYEDADPFTFTRYHDQWGYRWKMQLDRETANNLALYIQDSDGNYLYTTGALIAENGGWFTECPAGQADATPTDVYFHWILGSGRISGDFVYRGVDDILTGVVRSDEDYD